jgi:rhodanese-related sulfurtransferase
MAISLREMLAQARSEIDLVSPDELEQNLDEDGVLVVDVREKSEFESAHLPGAIQVSRAFLEVKADPEHPGREPALENRSRPVVTYCTGGIGMRSIMSAQTLKRMGFEQVACLEGGLDAWREAGKPVE